MITQKQRTLDLRSTDLKLERSIVKEFSKIAFPTKAGLDFIPILDILYCQSHGNYTQVYLTGRRQNFIGWMLGHIENKLPESWFIRVHHQYLINIQHILRYEKGDGGLIYLTDEIRIPVSRDRKRAFLEKVLGRVGGQMEFT